MIVFQGDGDDGEECQEAFSLKCSRCFHPFEQCHAKHTATALNPLHLDLNHFTYVFCNQLNRLA